MGWTARSIPDQSGRTAVVTGASSGTGYVAARELARRGARVVLACRDPHRAERARRRLLAEVPEARAEVRRLDLAELSSVREFAHGLPCDRLELLINNAGLMGVPFALTADGFESQFGVNHLGHYALTGLLLERLRAAPGARVVSMASFAHAFADLDLSDLLYRRRSYRPMPAYSASKTAVLLFTRELARRVERARLDLTVAAAHPGWARTGVHTWGLDLAGRPARERVAGYATAVLASSADHGATPLLYAATASDVRNDAFVGPRIAGLWGGPAPAWRASWVRNDVAAQRLWNLSERLTGVAYPELCARPW